MKNVSACSVTECASANYARALCRKHYERLRLHGDTSVVMPDRGNLIPRMRPEDRFWPRVNRVEDEDSCWEWMGGKYERGYGAFMIHRDGRKRNTGAHRFSYELAYGPIPAGMFVCHRCDNPPCVRPDHLFLGTNTDNVRDMVSKKRENHAGEHNGRAVLTAEGVRVIKDRLRAGEAARPIAADYGVSRETINAIRRGKAWSCR